MLTKLGNVHRLILLRSHEAGIKTQVCPTLDKYLRTEGKTEGGQINITSWVRWIPLASGPNL